MVLTGLYVTHPRAARLLHGGKKEETCLGCLPCLPPIPSTHMSSPPLPPPPPPPPPARTCRRCTASSLCSCLLSRGYWLLRPLLRPEPQLALSFCLPCETASLSFQHLEGFSLLCRFPAAGGPQGPLSSRDLQQLWLFPSRPFYVWNSLKPVLPAPSETDEGYETEAWLPVPSAQPVSALSQ